MECTFSLLFTVREEVDHLIQALGPFKELGIILKHIETRPSKTNPESEYDVFLESRCSRDILPVLEKRLKDIVGAVTIHELESEHTEKPTAQLQVPWFPRCIQDLERACKTVFNYGEEFTPDHPVSCVQGYGDTDYKKRREFIAQVAQNYRYGDPFPKIEYTKEEIETWGKVLKQNKELYPTHACKEYNEQFPKLFEACGFREDSVPHLADVSQYLKACTGFQLWPAAGWMSSRDFLSVLAFRVFPATQYLRHHHSPFYTPEPDICHELMGHCPLFADPSFAQFSQEIGLASLGVSDEWIDKLATLYWFTIEFGLCQEDGKPKAYGAGVLSSAEEMKHSVSDDAELRDFDCSKAVVQTYPNTGIQPLYFVARSFSDMKEQLLEFSKTIPRPYALSYNAYTQSVEVLDSYEKMENYTRNLKYDIGVLQNALHRKQTLTEV